MPEIETPPSTKERPSAFDGFAKAASDEPIFTLIAHDPQAAPLVEEWADRTRKDAREIGDDGKREEKLRQCSEAEQVAWAMRRYIKGEPEIVQTARASYSGGDAKIEQWRIDISKAAQHLRNAAYEIGEGYRLFDELALLDADDKVALRSAQNIANDLATEREPTRASFGQRPTLADIKGN